MIRSLLAVLLLALTASCVVVPTDPLAALRQPDGRVVWQGEYAFVPPERDWYLVTLDEEDYSVAFSRECRDGFPCQSTMAYVEEPFGYSTDLNQRATELFRRYLWASRVVFAPPELSRADIHGQSALVARIEGVEPVKGQKVYSKVIFLYRGPRVVAFYYNQWRSAEVPFDRSDEEDFDRFVASFTYLIPSFYERL